METTLQPILLSNRPRAPDLNDYYGHALADPLRLAILERLMDGPAAVTELIVLTGEAQSKVSNHLTVLREHGLVIALEALHPHP